MIPPHHHHSFLGSGLPSKPQRGSIFAVIAMLLSRKKDRIALVHVANKLVISVVCANEETNQSPPHLVKAPNFHYPTIVEIEHRRLRGRRRWCT
jgi:hypothetical protein